MDASIRASERRTMVAIEVVNLRGDHIALRDEVDTLRRYLYSLWRVEAHQALDRSEAHSRALEARIAVLETQMYRHEWQRQDADDHATRAMMPIMYSLLSIIASMAIGLKMPPKRTAVTTTPMTDAQIMALIAQGVVDSLAKCDADRSRNGDDIHDSGSDGRRQMPVARECTYSDFLKCQPLNFKGTEGVVRNALTWWNSHFKIVHHDAAYDMPWKTLMKMMTDKYCPRGEIKKLEIEIWNLKSDKVEKYVDGLLDMIQGSVMVSKPKKMQDAIEFVTELMD
ncbi:hypothetical protein Tco_0266814 [Tanacetum coccineum]